MAYLALLKGIQEDALTDIASFSERNLYREFHEGLYEVNRETQRIQLLNNENFPNNIEIKVIDFNQNFGAFIDREENKAKRVQPINNFLANRFGKENFRVCMPDMTTMQGDKRPQMPLTFEMLLRVETNLKLNLIDLDGRPLIPESEREDDEVHFVKFESLI